MKSTLIAVALLIFALTFGAAKPANYAGNWTLDLKQSKNLPPYYANIQSHKLGITQDEKHLSVAVEIGRGPGEPDRVNFVYNLDGSETKTETAVRGPGGMRKVPTTLKAVVADDGGLRITIEREIAMPDRTFKGVTTEDWALSADAKTLTIHRADDSPRGKTEADMIFVRE